MNVIRCRRNSVLFVSVEHCKARRRPVIKFTLFPTSKTNTKSINTMENSTNNSKGKGAAEKKPDAGRIKLIIGIFLCIYIATMIISGGLTYYLTIPKKLTPDQVPPPVTPSPADTVKELAGSAPVDVALPQGNFSWKLLGDDTCTKQPPCPETYNCSTIKCVPDPIKCRERTKEENDKCPPTCTPYPKGKFPDWKSFAESKELFRTNKVELFNNFPPYSKDRFYAVTKILQDTVELWAESGFLHRCDKDLRYKIDPWEHIKCSFCKDRYKYTACIMSSNKITRRDPAASALPNKQAVPVNDFLYYPDQGPVRPSLKLLPWIIASDNLINVDPGIPIPGHKDPKKMFQFPKDMNDLLREHFKEIHKTIRSLWVENDQGKLCRVCEDFNEKVYDKCLWSGYGWDKFRAPYKG